MEEPPLPDKHSPGDRFSFHRSDGPIDFIRSQATQTQSSIEPSDGCEVCDEALLDVIRQIARLIREYVGTAGRVGVDLDHALLLKVVESLRRESLGEPHPLATLTDTPPIERFLAESLYREILELPPVKSDASQDDLPTSLTPAEWRSCLELLSDFLAENSSPCSHEN